MLYVDFLVIQYSKYCKVRKSTESRRRMTAKRGGTEWHTDSDTFGKGIAHITDRYKNQPTNFME
jgi:hypothetical protein